MKTKYVWSGAFWLCLALAGIHAGMLAQSGPASGKESAVDEFMTARMPADSVEARKLMTAGLEDEYLHSKRLSVRVRSGRVVAFEYDPAGITSSGDKEFQVEVKSIWADLNEQVYESQFERLKFVRVGNDWLADKIHFLRSVPYTGLPPFRLEDQKRAKGALTVAKRFAKARVNRNPKAAAQLVSQEFLNQFQDQASWDSLIAGSSAPLFTAYNVRDLKVQQTGEVEITLGFYLVDRGKRGSRVVEAHLSLKEGRSDWYVDDFEVVKQ